MCIYVMTQRDYFYMPTSEKRVHVHEETRQDINYSTICNCSKLETT